MDCCHTAATHLRSRSFVVILLLLLVAETAQAVDPLLTTPPTPPVRVPAEFEPMQAVIVCRGFRDAYDFQELISEQVTLIMLSDQEAMPPIPPEYDVNMANCEFYQITSDFLVPRDELPWLAFADHNEAVFIHNHRETLRYGTPEYGLEQGYRVYRSGVEMDGGNFMTDGQGIAVSLEAFLPNGKKQTPNEGLQERALDYWGVHTHHLIRDDINAQDYYFHIDCLAKFLAPDTIMVARVPASAAGQDESDAFREISDARREKCEETAAYFRRQVSCYGTPYRVVRVDTPDFEPYTNSLIVNHRVYVPICPWRPEEVNADAIASYEAAMPGYEVIGIASGMWDPEWALHCDTMGIPDEQMLYIEHTPILDRPAMSEGFPIGAKIVAYSGEPFIEETPVVVWKVQDQNDWNRTGMTLRSDLGESRYLATIPTHPVGTVIEYYLHAEDASGRSENHPYIGAPQAHTFTVKPFGADVSAVSAGKGGAISFYMNAGADHAGRNYRLTYSLYADSEDPGDPGETLPETTVFAGFDGALDDAGIGAARMTLPEALPLDYVGKSLLLSLELDDPQSASLDAVRIQILD